MLKTTVDESVPAGKGFDTPLAFMGDVFGTSFFGFLLAVFAGDALAFGAGAFGVGAFVVGAFVGTVCFFVVSKQMTG